MLRQQQQLHYGDVMFSPAIGFTQVGLRAPNFLGVCFLTHVDPLSQLSRPITSRRITLWRAGDGGKKPSANQIRMCCIMYYDAYDLVGKYCSPVPRGACNPYTGTSANNNAKASLSTSTPLSHTPGQIQWGVREVDAFLVTC